MSPLGFRAARVVWADRMQDAYEHGDLDTTGRRMIHHLPKRVAQRLLRQVGRWAADRVLEGLL